MLAILLGLFRLIWLFGRGHHAVVLENLALRQQLAIYKRKKKRPRLVGRERWFWIALSAVWKDWRRPLFVVHLTRLYAGSGSVSAGTGRNGPRSREGWGGLPSAVRSAS